jgi:hypothetical protein
MFVTLILAQAGAESTSVETNTQLTSDGTVEKPRKDNSDAFQQFREKECGRNSWKIA